MYSDTARQLSALAGFAVLVSLPMAAAEAQQESGRTTLEEIVVTAAYREQGLQDVPVSIAAVTGDVITETAIQKAEDIQFLVPNFSLTETGIGTNAFIRGIGSGINQAFEQSVGTYIDGVYYGRAQQWRSPFLDIARVEVLRGPQSILFGKNSVAGALNISTAKPTREFEASALVSWEFEDNESIVEGMVSGPITDRMRYRIAARNRELDGHMWNATTGEDEPHREDWMARATLEFDVTDDLLATLKVESGEFDVTGRHIEIVNEQPAVAGPFTGLEYNQILRLVFGADPSVSNVVQDEVRSSNGDFSNNQLDNAVLTLDWAFGDFDLESITAYSKFEYDEFCDCDFTGAVVFGAALQEQYKQISQELRLSSPLGGKFDYIAGLYYQTSDHDYADQIIVPANSILVPAINAQAPGFGNLVANTQASRIATVDNDVLSAFAQFNWHFTNMFTLQLGGRVTNDKRDGFRTLSIVGTDFAPLPAPQAPAPLVYANLFGISSTNLASLGPTGAALIGLLGELPVEGSRDKTKFSPEVRFIFDTSDNSLWYLSWSEGYKSGSYDFRANNRNFYPDMESSFEFDDEKASNVEWGGKFTLAEGAAELNFAAFYTKYDDLQISIFDGILGFNVGNAASAKITGLETEFRWAATEHLTVSSAFAYTDFKFTDFENGQCYFGQAPNVDLDGDGTPELCSYTGKSNQMVSKFQMNTSFDIRVPVSRSLDLHSAFDVFYTSDYDASATFDPALVQEGYTMVNARMSLGAQNDRWQVAFLVKNLTDEKVLTFGGDTPLAGSTFGAKSNYAFFRTGRTMTLQTLFRF
jgi:iron complex outermembrane recepter protein